MINLEKGQVINLEKEAGHSLTKCYVGLGWDEAGADSEHDYDADLIVFGLGSNDKLPTPADFVFYNSPNLQNADGTIKLSGDNRTGDAEGDDESVILDLANMRPEVTKIEIFVNLHDAIDRKQHLGQLQSAYVHITDGETETSPEIAKATITSIPEGTGMYFAELIRTADGWDFKAVEEVTNETLQDIITKYG